MFLNIFQGGPSIAGMVRKLIAGQNRIIDRIEELQNRLDASVSLSSTSTSTPLRASSSRCSQMSSMSGISCTTSEFDESYSVHEDEEKMPFPIPAETELQFLQNDNMMADEKVREVVVSIHAAARTISWDK